MERIGGFDRVLNAFGDFGSRHQTCGGGAFREAGGNQLSPVSLKGADAPLPFSGFRATNNRSEHEVVRKRRVEDFSCRPFGKVEFSRARSDAYVDDHCRASCKVSLFYQTCRARWRAIRAGAHTEMLANVVPRCLIPRICTGAVTRFHDSVRKSARRCSRPSRPNPASIAACSRCHIGRAVARRLRPGGVKAR